MSPAAWLLQLDKLSISPVMQNPNSFYSPHQVDPANLAYQANQAHHQQASAVKDNFVKHDGPMDRSETVDICGGGSGVDTYACVALPDSGTSFIALPLDLFQKVVKVIQTHRPDCGLDSNKNVICTRAMTLGPDALPTLQFTFAGVPFTLTGEDYLLQNGQLALQTVDLPSNPGVEWKLIILGDVFLRKVFTVFDADTPAVGFATLSNSEPLWSAWTLQHTVAWLRVISMLLLLLLGVHWFLCGWRRSNYEHIPDSDPFMEL